MGSSRYLLRRGLRYYFRLHVPRELQPFFGREELRRSLKTSCYDVARGLARLELGRAERVFGLARSGMMTVAEIRKMVAAYFDRNLEEAEESRLDGVGLLVDSEDGEHGGSNTEGLELHLVEMQESLARGEYKGIMPVADSILEEAGITVDRGSREYLKLCREALKAAIAATNIELQRMRGNYQEPRPSWEDRPTSESLPAEDASAGADRLMSKLIAEYAHEQMSGGRWRGRTRNEAEGCLGLLMQLLGDRDIRTITRKELISFRDSLKMWPSNAFKAKQFRDKTAQEVLAIQRSGKGTGKTLAIKTINKYLIFVGALFRWAVANGYLDTSYADQLAISKRNVKPSEEREAYDVADLKHLLSSPLYTTKLPTKRPERYWLPLIALLSGMRLAEISQLYVSDVREESGVPVFDVNDGEDKSLKNAASRRVVPIHPMLLELGLLQYVEGLRKKKMKRLWPNLKLQQGVGYGQDIGKWFQRVNRRYITENPLRTFHSFRHTFETAMQRAHVPLPIVQQITGHSHGSIDYDRYAKGFNAGPLLEELKKVKFGVEDELRALPKWREKRK